MTDALKNLSDALAQTVENASPSVVRVEARRRLPATGIVWSENVIVTAHHVVEQDENITIGLHDGSTVTAALAGRDAHNDLAVLKTDASLTPANWASEEDVKVGHLVLALGRPGSDLQATLGVISALVGASGSSRGEEKEKRGGRGRRHGGGRGRGGRGGRRGHALRDGFVQTDVTMYPGFSGGPLVSADSAIYGLNTSGFSHGVSIAVPVRTIRNTVDTLLTHGKMKQGYIGVSIQPVRLPENIAKELDQETGILLTSVETDSPASQAGLIVGDILVGINDDSIQDVDELLAALLGDVVGQEVSLQIVHGGTLQTVAVTVGERD